MADERPTGFLTLPKPGEGTVGTLVRKVRLLALRQLLVLPGDSLDKRTARSLGLLQEVVQQMARRDSDAVLDAVGAPDVLVPLLVLSAGLRPQESLLYAVIPAFMARLSAHRSSIPEAILWEAPVETIATREAVFRFSPAAKALLVDASGLAVELADGTRIELTGGSTKTHEHLVIETPFHDLGSAEVDLHLSLYDSNPLAMDEAHPDKAGNTVTLGDKALDAWVGALTEALDLIELALPNWHQEIRHSIHRVLPVGYEPEMHLSASYREAPGILYMTLHPSPLTLAEALVHEAQHGKLNLLSWLDPVLHNAYTAWSESPVRPDLRPVMGVLLAVHAFIPVAALHQGLAEMDHPISKTHRFAERRDEVLQGNAGGLKIVEEVGEPTPMGSRVIRDLRALHDAVSASHVRDDWDPTVLPTG